MPNWQDLSPLARIIFVLGYIDLWAIGIGLLWLLKYIIFGKEDEKVEWKEVKRK